MSAPTVAAVSAEFRRRHGRDPDGLFVAPGRVNLIGEHTDYNDGLVLPIAIERSAVVAAGRRDDAVVTGWSAQRGDGGVVRIDVTDPPAVRGWLGYAAGVVWALRDVIGAGAGLDIVVDSDVPPGAGLSSSAALPRTRRSLCRTELTWSCFARCRQITPSPANTRLGTASLPCIPACSV